MLWLLLQAAVPAEAPPVVDPVTVLKGTVVAAIRNCGVSTSGEIVACSRDRGFAEGGRRLQKLKKPKPVDGGAGIKVEVTGGTRTGGSERQ